MTYEQDYLSGAHYYARQADNYIAAILDALERGHLLAGCGRIPGSLGSAEHYLRNLIRIGHWLD